MENYLVLNGQKIELTPEQYKEVCNAVSPKKEIDIFDKEYCKVYFYITDTGGVIRKLDKNELADSLHHLNANYCHNFELMKKRSRYENLERVLWRFSEENGGAGCYTIYMNTDRNSWSTLDIKIPAVLFSPTFCSRQVALRAIEVAKKWLSDNGLEPKDVFF